MKYEVIDGKEYLDGQEISRKSPDANGQWHGLSILLDGCLDSRYIAAADEEAGTVTKRIPQSDGSLKEEILTGEVLLLRWTGGKLVSLNQRIVGILRRMENDSILSPSVLAQLDEWETLS